MQDLADATGLLAKVAAGRDLRYNVHAELALDPQRGEETTEELGRILGGTHEDLKLG